MKAGTTHIIPKLVVIGTILGMIVGRLYSQAPLFLCCYTCWNHGSRKVGSTSRKPRPASKLRPCNPSAAVDGCGFNKVMANYQILREGSPKLWLRTPCQCVNTWIEREGLTKSRFGTPFAISKLVNSARGINQAEVLYFILNMQTSELSEGG